MTPSQAFLKLILGNEYIDGNNRANLRRFFELFPFHIDDEFLNVIETSLTSEKQEYHKGNLFCSHGLPGEQLFFCEYSSKANSVITNRDIKNSSLSLRGSQIALINPDTKKPYKTATEVIEKLGSEHHDKGCSAFLFFNPIMFLDPRISYSTDSSLGLLLADRSVVMRSLRDLVMEMWIEQGMSPGDAEQCYDEFHSLYEQFYGKRKNGGILFVSVPQSLEETHIANSFERRVNPSEMIISVQEEVKKLTPDRGNFLTLREEEQKRIRLLTDEGRLYIDPTINFQIFSRWHYNLSLEDQPKFDLALNRMVESHAMRLLRHPSIPIENAIIFPKPEQHLIYQFLSDVKKQTGKDLIITLQPNVFEFLFRKGFFEAAVSLIKGGEIKSNEEAILNKLLVQAFIRSELADEEYDEEGYIEGWKLLQKCFPKFSPTDHLTEEDKNYLELEKGMRQYVSPQESTATESPEAQKFIQEYQYTSSENRLELINQKCFDTEGKLLTWVLQSERVLRPILDFARYCIHDNSEEELDFASKLFKDPQNCEGIKHIFKTPSDFTECVRCSNPTEAYIQFIKNYLLDSEMGNSKMTLRRYIEKRIELYEKYSAGHEEDDEFAKRLLRV